MVDIQSKEVIDKISDELKVQPSMAIPRKLAEQIQLSFNVNAVPRVRVIDANISDTTSGVILTTSATSDTWVVGASISVAKSVVNDGLFSDIRVTPFGQADDQQLVVVRYEPVTAGSNISSSETYPFPILLAKNSDVVIVNQSGLASIDTFAKVLVYETDTL